MFVSPWSCTEKQLRRNCLHSVCDASVCWSILCSLSFLPIPFLSLPPVFPLPSPHCVCMPLLLSPSHTLRDLSFTHFGTLKIFLHISLCHSILRVLLLACSIFQFVSCLVICALSISVHIKINYPQITLLPACLFAYNLSL